MIDRYNCYGWDIRRGEMRLEQDGKWVRHSDYAALEAQLAKALNRVVLEDDGGAWQADDIGHPRHSADTRDEIELFMRDAFASGCRAAQNRSLLTAVEYASRHAPELRRRLSALEATPSAPKVTECATEDCERPATVRFERGGVGSDYCHGCYMRIQALTAAQESGE